MIGNRIRRPLKLAIEIAKKANNGLTWHLAAVLTKGKEIVSVGFNKCQTHPKENSPFRFLHAESDCIIGVDQEKLNRASLFVARMGYDFRQEVLLAKPCDSCTSMIIRSGIRWVYYTIDNSTLGVWDVRNNNFDVEHIESLV